MIEIGSCDWCGRFCQNGSHAEWAEALQSCISLGHTGPWHGADGRPRVRCEGHPGEPLDHKHDCPVCAWNGAGGRSVLTGMRLSRSGARGKLASPADAGPASTERVSSDAVSAALRDYLGTEPPPVTVVPSPLVLGERYVEADRRVLPKTELGWEVRPERPGWSLGVPDYPWVRRVLAEVGAPGVPVADAASIGEVLSWQLNHEVKSRWWDGDGFDRLMVDAGQFDDRSRHLAAAVRERRVRPNAEMRDYVRLMGALAATAGPMLVLADEIIVSDRPLELHLDESGRPSDTPDGLPAIRYRDGWEVRA